VIQKKSYDFALRMVHLARFLITEKQEFVLSKQILKSGTSIGANVEEAIGAQSKKDFFAKICIAYKESRETSYWIRLLIDSDLLEKKVGESLKTDCTEIEKILSSIKMTTEKDFKK